MAGGREDSFEFEGAGKAGPPPEGEGPLYVSGVDAGLNIAPAATDGGEPRRPSVLWAFVPFLLFLLGAASVALTQRSIGYAWDESFYYEPARDAAAWVVGIVQGRLPLDATTIDRYWTERHEHPSFHKLISGFSLMAFDELLGPLEAMRLPIALLFGASLSLLYLLGRLAWGNFGGLVSALAYAAMPRIFGDAHFSSMETPLVFSVLLTVYCFVRGLNSPIWAALTGISLGLLLATKINGFFLIPPLVLWGYLYGRSRSAHNLFYMAVLGPIVFVGLWPWLWPSPVLRLLDYFSFHAQHQQTALYFMGRKWGYGDELAPWFYPSVMIGVTLPISVLVLSALGLLFSIFSPRRCGVGILFLLIGLTMWGVASAPSTPKYDGVRLFIPVFPFLALLAGGGGALLLHLVWRAMRNDRQPGREVRLVRLAGFGLAAIVAAEGGLASARYYPYLLSYFNPIVGGLRGAAAQGYEVTYWGEAVNDDVLDTLNKVIPDGASLKVLALHELNFEQLQRWGKLKPSIRIGGPPPYYAHLLLMRRGFFARPETALADTARFFPLQEWRLQDVPLLALYSTGATFEQFWPTLEPHAPSALDSLPSN